MSIIVANIGTYQCIAAAKAMFNDMLIAISRFQMFLLQLSFDTTSRNQWVPMLDNAHQKFVASGLQDYGQ